MSHQQRLLLVHPSPPEGVTYLVHLSVYAWKTQKAARTSGRRRNSKIAFLGRWRGNPSLCCPVYEGPNHHQEIPPLVDFWKPQACLFKCSWINIPKILIRCPLMLLYLVCGTACKWTFPRGSRMLTLTHPSLGATGAGGLFAATQMTWLY